MTTLELENKAVDQLQQLLEKVFDEVFSSDMSPYSSLFTYENKRYIEVQLINDDYQFCVSYNHRNKELDIFSIMWEAGQPVINKWGKNIYYNSKLDRYDVSGFYVNQPENSKSRINDDFFLKFAHTLVKLVVYMDSFWKIEEVYSDMKVINKFC